MINLIQLQSKLDELQAYSQNIFDNDDEKEYVSTEIGTFFVPVRNSVDNYFNGSRTDLEQPLKDLSLALYSDCYNRHEVRDNTLDMGYRDDFPPAYNDLTLLFHDFSYIINCTNEEFFNAWVVQKSVPEQPQSDTDTSTSGSSTYSIVSNSLLDEWLVKINNALNTDKQNIAELYAWLSSSGGKAGEVRLWEELGAVKSIMGTKEIAQNIFIDRKFKECIDFFHLPAYTPTYL